MRALRLQNPAGVFGDLSAFAPVSPTLGKRAVLDDVVKTWAVSARLVPAAFGHRCCAPGCGEKIKPLDASDTMYEVLWTDGTVRYLEEQCVFDFVHGHVDYGGGHGRVPGLPDFQPRRPFDASRPSQITLTRFVPATASPTLVVKTAWAGADPAPDVEWTDEMLKAGDDLAKKRLCDLLGLREEDVLKAPGPSAGHMRVSVDGGPAKDIPIPASATAEGLDAVLEDWGVFIRNRKHAVREQRRAEEAARPEKVKARWLKQVEALTDEELETVLAGWNVFTRDRKRVAKRFGVRRFFQVGLTPEETARAQSFIRLDLYAHEDD